MRVQDIGLKTKKKSPSKEANKMCFQQDDFKKRGSEGAYTKEIPESKFVAELEYVEQQNKGGAHRGVLKVQLTPQFFFR